jgi:hypothetical protein
MEVIVNLPNGAIVSRATDGTLFITGTQGARQIGATNPVALLPLLERGPDDLSAEATAALPISQVLSLALTWGTTADHWPRLAVEWLSRTGVPAEVRSSLEDFAHSDRGSRQTRHAARRLLRELE